MPLLQKSSDWHSHSEFHRVTESGVVLELRTAAAVVSQLNRHQCEDRTPGENTCRADRDQVAEQNSDPACVKRRAVAHRHSVSVGPP